MMRPSLCSGQCEVTKFTMLQARGSLSRADVYSRSVKGGRGPWFQRQDGRGDSHPLTSSCSQSSQDTKSWRTTHIEGL